MDKNHIVVSFNLSETGLRSRFRKFLSDHLEEDLAQTFSGEVTDDQLKTIKQEAGNVEYEDVEPSDKIIVYEHETLGMKKSVY
ncbi:MAG: hypothetical protein ABEK50_10655 [bacterium]